MRILMMTSMTVPYLQLSQVHIRRNLFHNGQEVRREKQSVKNHTFSNLFFFIENELQIAMCNQIYFHRNPIEIFGNSIDCSPAHLRTILHSMLPNVQLIDDDQHLPTSIPWNSNQSILV